MIAERCGSQDRGLRGKKNKFEVVEFQPAQKT